MVAGLINKDIENYGILQVTPAGHEFLKTPHSFQLVKNHKYEEDEDDSAVQERPQVVPGEIPNFSIC
jgi:ATP-dependent DNA helicase RecQ